MVYQYILLVQKLAEYDEVRATYIYRRGSYIVKRLLGRDHRFSVMMREITKLKKHTNKLIREDKERDK